jgi:hypothetical protein
VLHEGLSALYEVRASHKENKFNRSKTTHLANAEALWMFGWPRAVRKEYNTPRKVSTASFRRFQRSVVELERK